MSTPPKPRVTRPDAPGYFLPADGGTGLLDWTYVEQRLVEAVNYWVATCDASGRPHCMPVWGIWDGHSLLFSTSPRSRKARNLSENPYIVVHLESGDQVVVLEGRADEVRDGPALLQFLESYNPKYQWHFELGQLQTGGVYAVRPDKVFAWLDGRGEGFSGAGTRWIFPE